MPRGAMQRMESLPPLHLCVGAIEKVAFRSLSTKVANFTLPLHKGFSESLLRLADKAVIKS